MNMRLWYAPTSPFARKVRIAAAELGLSNQIELAETNPWSDDDLRKLNPLSKVPTLVAEDGMVLFESGVICEYLASLVNDTYLFPTAGPNRWWALRLQGLADGAATSAGRLFADERRPGDERSETMMERLRLAIFAALGALEDELLGYDKPTIGDVAVAMFLGYLDFRWPDRNWRVGRPAVSEWFAAFSERPSMLSTTHRSISV